MTIHVVKKYAEFRQKVRDDFGVTLEPLMREPRVQKLQKYRHHLGFNRLSHSVEVAYRSYFLARILNLDCNSVARAALLHDLFFEDEMDCKRKIVRHPKIALKNAEAIYKLTDMEKDIILKHMFLLTPMVPVYKESYVVTCVDKYCAMRELLLSAMPQGGKRVFDYLKYI